MRLATMVIDDRPPRLIAEPTWDQVRESICSLAVGTVESMNISTDQRNGLTIGIRPSLKYYIVALLGRDLFTLHDPGSRSEEVEVSLAIAAAAEFGTSGTLLPRGLWLPT